MFAHNPELKNIFNMSNQRSGGQPQALFDSLCAYAVNIENLGALLPAVERIAQKHCSFNITPEMYSIVGLHLLETIREEFNPGEEILNAWGDAYKVLADVFIKREEQLYSEAEKMVGGWRGTREFTIVKKEKQSDAITSFLLKPVDGGKVVSYQPGQYLGVYIDHPSFENREIRHYSLTLEPNTEYYRIAVKKEQDGRVSSFLHEVAKDGDVIKAAAPRGDFFLNASSITSNTPVTLISGGVGQTPLLSMLHYLQTSQHQGQVNWVHAAQNLSTRAFNEEVEKIGATLPKFKSFQFLSEVSPSALQVDNTFAGRINLSQLDKDLIKQDDMHYYTCGPVGFMQEVAKQLLSMGVPVSNIHYELFGPHKVI
ncbi:flavohemoglobin [Cavenderia fasciculata]|uniref:nitric oxide dioxygenase n=1 Tax=Cavenderia fasciculata TaxID=261658 RepID=F4PWN7_CACFS|nr:flavohemoglobin [Cavenderia fasciculata]EGG20401.1 flavohemoglobin [Cavenderia fasciculata]|eukprot:XP_004367384.1 flavohemoglobin [Cavenderia fasciculata]